MITKGTIKQWLPPGLLAVTRPVRRMPHLVRVVMLKCVFRVWEILLVFYSAYRFYFAYLRYGRTGIVPADAYPILPPTYILTNGRMTDYLAYRLARLVPPVEEVKRTGVVPALSTVEHQTALAELRRDGLYIFQRKLDARVCDDLVAFACRTPCMPLGDGLPRNQAGVLFDPSNPVAPTYWFDQQELAEVPLVQRLLTDPTCLRLAQDYLGMEPILNIHTMWWSTAFRRSADHVSAQLFHFDLDRAKFLKFFIYLIDVGEQNGPHVYVRGTHVRKVRPLLREGRIPDEELFSYYPRNRAVTVTGLKGTVFAEDTRGFHKGLPVIKGTRLVFELEYVSDRFGRSEPVIQLNQRFGADFRAWQARHPRVLCRFTSNQAMKTTADLRMV